MATLPAVTLNCPACSEPIELAAGVEDMRISHHDNLIAVVRVDAEPLRAHVAAKHPDAA
jgi:hypothetical protein